MILAAAIISFFAVLAWDLRSDYKKWLKTRSVQHSKEWWVRVALMIPSIALFTLAHPREAGYAWSTLLVLGLSAGMTGFAFWILFDGIYNRLRGYQWTFTGSVEADDADLDKMQREMGKAVSMLIKLAGFLVCLTAYILPFKH